LKIKWLKDVADHDYEAAFNYLSILLDDRRAQLAVKELKKAEVTNRRANDILRACGHLALPLSDPGVQRDFARATEGEKLSPVLVVSFARGGDIADGYHRVSLVADLDPYGVVPCRLAHVPQLQDALK
jgi:hypothetical protein